MAGDRASRRRPPVYCGGVTTVLLVEDDAAIAGPLSRALQREGYEVDVVGDGQAALHRAGAAGPDLMVLDLGLPGMDGLEVCRRVRVDQPDLPVLMLTARTDEVDFVVGLDAGADDYVVKPFAYQEVAARLRALARRAEPGPRRAEPVLTAGAIALDEAARRVTVSGRNVDLSPREFSLLEALLRHAGQTLTRDQLLDQAWPFSVAVTPNAVDAYVHYLRTKLGDAGSQVETVRGVGYRLADG
jgi:DNA-binding response OmpR family regulator